MSSSSTPIDPHRFAEAIQELPLSSLHLKAAELRNSIEHLHSSNQQLQSFAAQGDHDCAEASRENVEVMGRMEKRITLLKVEVERRGYSWSEEPRNVNGAVGGDMTVDVNWNEEAERRRTHRNTSRGPIDGSESIRRHNGGLGDDELSRRLRMQLDEVGDDRDGDGLHL